MAVAGGELTAVGLGEVVVPYQPSSTLVAYGLGSCVAVCIYEPARKVGGMAHILLPSSGESNSQVSTKYADIAIPYLIEGLLQLGASRSKLVAKIAGGAQMLNLWGANGRSNIGERNACAVREILAKESIWLAAAETGGTIGRTVVFCIDSGKVTVKTAGAVEKEL